MSSTGWNPQTKTYVPQYQGPTKSCPGCGHGTTILDDKYCRKCGVRILMVCSECEKSVRPDDKFCAHCGHRRWKLYELWRYGMLHKSPLFVLGTVALAGGAYLALYMFLDSSKRRILR